jgi:hypothetical protein
MKKQWEYYSDHGVSGFELDKLGKEGWELVSVADGNKYFKREIQQPENGQSNRKENDQGMER